MAKRPRGSSQLVRTTRSLLVIALVGGSLAVYNYFSVRSDVGLATGPTGPAQEKFFASAAERPDLELFYKALTPTQRVTMAERLGEYGGTMAPVIGKLLGTFDAEAREKLSQSLVKIAQKDPDAVASQFALSGSFQQIAVVSALESLGPSSLAVAAQHFDLDAERANASAYLVSQGPESIRFLTPKLSSEKPEIRLAAADTLGKLRANSAVPALTALYGKANGAERIGYLSAIASIGDPSSEELLRNALLDETLTIPQRSQAALGLGRVGGAGAVRTLVPLADHPDRGFRDSVRSGLALTGDAALTDPSVRLDLRIEVAGSVQSEASDALLRSALADAPTRKAAAEAAHLRPNLVPDLVTAARQSDDGEVADAALRALATTEAGKAALAALKSDPKLAGLAARRERIGPG